MFETYIPGFSNMLMNSDMLTFQPELTGGGPAYTTITPDFMPEPAEGPAPAAVTPQDDFLERIRRAEAMVPVAQPPSIMPSPSAPPIMSAPGFGAPGFTNMLMRPDLLEGGPAYADMMPGTMGGAIDQVSMLPFAPEAPAAAPASYVPGFSPMLLNQAVSAQPERAISGFEDYERTLGSLNPALEYEQSAGRVGGQSVFDPTGLTFLTDRGRSAGYGANKSGFVAFDPNAQYRMWDERGKQNQIISSGTGEEGLRNIYNLANQFNKEQGKKANWGIERLNPATGQWERILENDPAKNIAGKIIGGALPLAMLAIPGFGQLGFLAQGAIGAGLGGAGAAIAGRDPLKGAIIGGLTAGAGAAGGKLGAAGKLGSIGAKTGAVIGSGLGATTGGLATGQSLGQALKGGVLAGAGTFAGQQLTGALRDIGVNLPAFNTPTPSTPGEILVTAPSGGVSIPVPTGMGGGSGKPRAPEPEPGSGGLDDTGITVTTSRGALPFFAAGIPVVVPGGLPMTPAEVARQQELDQQQEQEPITVTTGRNLVNLGAAAAPLAAPSAEAPTTAIDNVIEVTKKRPTVEEAFADISTANVGALNTPENEIVVTAPEKAPTSFDKQPTLPLAPTLPDLTKTPVDVQGPEKSFLDKLKENLSLSDYLRLAGLGIGLLSGGGGGGRGALSTIPRGLFGGSGPFGGSLPRATLPGASTGFAPRPASTLRPQTTQDWYRYGYGPSQSFFSYVPEGERNLSQAYTGYAHGGMAEGGDTFAVNGPGTGRSDEIPAMLSDGEYVIDAETVALLGDGSSKAGAERLDQFRINVRRDKGRKLAKGEFSVDAKRPEHYLKGGRA